MGTTSQSESGKLQMHAETITPSCLRLIEFLGQIPFTQQFYLVGGTALSLQLGHRHSVDLDFFSTEEFTPLPAIGKIKEFPNTGDFTFQENHLEFHIPLTKIEFVYFAYPPHHELVEWNGIRMLSPRDIGLFKLLAIIGRNRKKDIADLYFIDKEVIKIEDLVADFIAKYDKGDINLLKQIEKLLDDKAMAQSDDPMMLKPLDLEKAYREVKVKLIGAIKAQLPI